MQFIRLVPVIEYTGDVDHLTRRILAGGAEQKAENVDKGNPGYSSEVELVI